MDQNDEDEPTVLGLTPAEIRELLDKAAVQGLGVFDSFEALVKFVEGQERREVVTER